MSEGWCRLFGTGAPYLWGRRFVIRMDHRSLRFLLD